MSAGLRHTAAAVALVALATPALGDCGLARASIAGGEPQVLTLDEASGFLQIEAALLADAAASGEVPSRRVAGEWRFVRAALIAWLAGQDEPEDCFDAPQAAEGVPPAAPWTQPEAVRQERTPASPLQNSGMTATAARQLPSAAGASRQELGVGAQASAIPEPSPAVGVPSVGLRAPRPIAFGEEPEQETAREVALREQIMLTRRGSFSLETDIFYTRQDQDLSTLAPFGVAVASRRAEEAGVALTGRYGLRDDLQLSFGLPWSRRVDELSASSFDRTVTLGESSDSGFRGARVGLQYAVSAEGLRRPAVLVSAEGRIPLDGTDAYGLGAGVMLVKSIDPATLFGGISYLHTFNREDDSLAPEGDLSVTAGLAFAMNDRLSLSSAVTGSFAPRSKGGNVVRPSEESYSLRLALTGLASDNLYLEPWVSMQLNGPQNAVTFGLSLPYRLGR